MSQLSRYNPRNSALARQSAYVGLGSASYPIAQAASRYLQRNYGSAARYVGSTVKNYLAAGKMKRAAKLNASRSGLRGRSFRAAVGKQIAAGGGGESKSYFTLTKQRYMPKKLDRMLGTCTVNRSTGSSSSSGQGVQNAKLLNMSWDAADLTNAFATVGEAVGTAATRAGKLLLMGCHSQAIITNAETTNAHFTIYDVICKSDKGSNNADAPTTFLAGFVDQNDGTANDSGYVGATPWGNPRFTANYKVLQNTKIILSPGQTHVHYIHYDPQRVYNLERLYNNATTTGGLAGLTLQSFIVQHGSPVHDDTTETSVTIGITKLDIVLLEQLQFKQILRDISYASITTSLVSNLTGFQMAENAPADIADAS